MSKNCVVTGSEGFIGRLLVRYLKETTDYNVLPYDIKNSPEQDIRKHIKVDCVDYVVHLAALKGVRESEGQLSRDYIETNCWGTVNVLKSFPKARILNISSSSAEEAKSVYGATKRFGEMVALTHSNCLSVRLYNVFGEGQSLASGAVVPQFVNCFLTGETPVIRGDGSQTRDFTYVGDVIIWLKNLLENNEKGLVHLGYGESMSVLQLLQEIYSYLPSEIEYLPMPAYEILTSKSPQEWYFDSYGREKGLKRTIEWWKKRLAV